MAGAESQTDAESSRHDRYKGPMYISSHRAADWLLQAQEDSFCAL